MTNKCSYCNKKTEALTTCTELVGNQSATFRCCSDECQEKAIAYFRYVCRFQSMLLGVVFAFCLVLAPVALVSITVSPLLPSIIVSIGAFVVGLAVTLFPFSTPQTIAVLGIKKSVFLARGLGILTAAASLAYGFWITFIS